jgi:N-formylglutamate amidohydrolase
MANGGSILVKQNSITIGWQDYIRILFFFSFAICGWALESHGQNQLTPHKLLTVWAGALPIILSAPHGGRQPIPGVAARHGVGVAQFATGRDNNTDELAQRIAAKLEERLSEKPFLIVAQFERKYLDVNRPRRDAYESAAAQPYYDVYHRALKHACEQVSRAGDRALLLDIHGQSEGDTVYRGTNNGKTISSLIRRFGTEAITGPKSIFGQLERMGYKIVPPIKESHKETRYAGGYIVQTYGSHREAGIDAIQLEFGTALRARANLDRTAIDLAHAIAVFARDFLPLVKSPSPLQAIAQP